MTKRLLQPNRTIGALALLLAGLAGCSPDLGHGVAGGDEGGKIAPRVAVATPAGAVQTSPGEQGTVDQPTESPEVSDLDRSVTELVALRCEHDQATYQCNECRYETGMVKVSPDLLTAGLVQTEPLALRRVQAPLDLTGQIAFDERRVAHVSPLVPGLVRRVWVDLGQQVVAGQPLFEIASAELAAAQGEWLEAQALLLLAEKNHQRQQALWSERVTSEREYLEAQQTAAAAAVRRSTTRQRLLRLGVTATELDTLTAQGLADGAGSFTVRAPVAGTVIRVETSLGELVEPGEDAVLLSDPSRLWVWADLYERQLAEVSSARRVGAMAATVTVEAYPKEVFSGTVDFVGAAMETSSRTVRVRVSLVNPGGRLRPGMFARVRLYPEGERQALVIPAVAVLSDEGRDFVFVRHDGDYFVRRPVKSGHAVGDLVEIQSGLEVGQRVVTAGAFLLKSDVLRSKMGAGCAD